MVFVKSCENVSNYTNNHTNILFFILNNLYTNQINSRENIVLITFSYESPVKFKLHRVGMLL